MTRIKEYKVPLIGGEDIIFRFPYPLSEQNYELIIKYIELVKIALVSEPEQTEMTGIRDVGPCGVQIIQDDHLQEEKKIEWGFEPKLGYEIEPTLTREEFEDVLTRVAAPIKAT